MGDLLQKLPSVTSNELVSNSGGVDMQTVANAWENAFEHIGPEWLQYKADFGNSIRGFASGDVPKYGAGQFLDLRNLFQRVLCWVYFEVIQFVNAPADVFKNNRPDLVQRFSQVDFQVQRVPLTFKIFNTTNQVFLYFFLQIIWRDDLPCNSKDFPVADQLDVPG